MMHHAGMTPRLLALPLVAALAALLGASAAPATASSTCPAAIDDSRRIIAGTDGQIPAGWSIVLHCEPGGIAAYTDPAAHEVRLYGQWADPDRLRWATVHELAHVHDIEYLSDADRQTWRTTRGIPPDTQWWSHGEMTHDEWAATGAEDLAQAAAACALGDPPSGTWSTTGGPPDAGHCVVLRWLLGSFTARG